MHKTSIVAGIIKSEEASDARGNNLDLELRDDVYICTVRSSIYRKFGGGSIFGNCTV